ncbi:hypothetical protein H0R92_06500 [Treponema sp. OMZ 840]|uniref:hypothetical protein n=1 Tax=Treponema sp. OMZ 840 TaxID=244313 RepID=UPI003D906E9C
MKKLKNIILFICIFALCAVLAAVYRHFSLKTNTIRVAFYGLPQSEVTVLSSWLDDKNVNWVARILDSSKPLNAHISNSSQYDLLFVYDGFNMDSMKSFVRNAETAALQMLPAPIRISIQTQRRLIGTPVLMNPFQLLCSKNGLESLDRSEPLSLMQLEDIAVKSITRAEKSGQPVYPAPFLCAGADDDHLIMFFSSLLEAAEGVENLEDAASLLAAQKDNDFSSFFAAEPIWNILELLAKWQKKGFLPARWLELGREEAADAMKKDAPLIVFAPHAFYRSLDEKAADKYTLWYMPSGKFSHKRFLVSQTVAALQFSVPKAALQSAVQARNKLDSVRALIRETVSAPAQTKLAQHSISVPVNSRAQISFPAETALEYICASDGIIPDVAQAALSSDGERKTFAQALRKEIKRISDEQ